MGFWGILVPENGSVTVRFTDPRRRRLRVTQATLQDNPDYFLTSNSKLFCQVGNDPPIAICCLRYKATEMFRLDLEFKEPDDVLFTVRGMRGIYLAGYYFEDPPPPPRNIIVTPMNVLNGDVTHRGEQASSELTLRNCRQIRGWWYKLAATILLLFHCWYLYTLELFSSPHGMIGGPREQLNCMKTGSSEVCEVEASQLQLAVCEKIRGVVDCGPISNLVDMLSALSKQTDLCSVVMYMRSVAKACQSPLIRVRDTEQLLITDRRQHEIPDQDVVVDDDQNDGDMIDGPHEQRHTSCKKVSSSEVREVEAFQLQLSVDEKVRGVGNGEDMSHSVDMLGALSKHTELCSVDMNAGKAAEVSQSPLMNVYLQQQLLLTATTKHEIQDQVTVVNDSRTDKGMSAMVVAETPQRKPVQLVHINDNQMIRRAKSGEKKHSGRSATLNSVCKKLDFELVEEQMKMRKELSVERVMATRVDSDNNKSLERHSTVAEKRGGQSIGNNNSKSGKTGEGNLNKRENVSIVGENHQPNLLDGNDNQRDDSEDRTCMKTDIVPRLLDEQKLERKKKRKRSKKSVLMVGDEAINKGKGKLEANQQTDVVQRANPVDGDDSEDRTCMKTDIVPRLLDNQKVEHKKKRKRSKESVLMVGDEATKGKGKLEANQQTDVVQRANPVDGDDSEDRTCKKTDIVPWLLDEQNLERKRKTKRSKKSVPMVGDEATNKGNGKVEVNQQTDVVQLANIIDGDDLEDLDHMKPNDGSKLLNDEKPEPQKKRKGTKDRVKLTVEVATIQGKGKSDCKHSTDIVLNVAPVDRDDTHDHNYMKPKVGSELLDDYTLKSKKKRKQTKETVLAACDEATIQAEGKLEAARLTDRVQPPICVDGDVSKNHSFMRTNVSRLLDEKKLEPKKKVKRTKKRVLMAGVEATIQGKGKLDVNQPIEVIQGAKPVDRDESKDQNCMKINVVTQLLGDQKLEPKKKKRTKERVLNQGEGKPDANQPTNVVHRAMPVDGNIAANSTETSNFCARENDCKRIVLALQVPSVLPPKPKQKGRNRN